LIDKKAHTFSAGLILILLFGIADFAFAQQTDTSRTESERELKTRTVPQPFHKERSTNNFLLPESGTYDVPDPTEYYTPPFEGQEYLDIAIAAYRQELEDSIGNTPFFKFLGKIAPFINTQFEFGVYRINDLPIIERDNPYLYPSTAKEQE
jgi:hypothetical protein